MASLANILLATITEILAAHDAIAKQNFYDLNPQWLQTWTLYLSRVQCGLEAANYGGMWPLLQKRCPCMIQATVSITRRLGTWLTIFRQVFEWWFFRQVSKKTQCQYQHNRSEKKSTGRYHDMEVHIDISSNNWLERSFIEWTAKWICINNISSFNIELQDDWQWHKISETFTRQQSEWY